MQEEKVKRGSKEGLLSQVEMGDRSKEGLLLQVEMGGESKQGTRLQGERETWSGQVEKSRWFS
jgi:hypothetical protein